MNQSLSPQPSHQTDIAVLLHALKNSNIFGQLDIELLNDFADMMTMEIVAGGEKIYTQGEDSASLTP